MKHDALAQPLALAAVLVLFLCCDARAEGPISLSVSVIGGAPIRDLPYDPLSTQSLDDDCTLTTRPASQELALAGVAGEPIVLEMDLVWCRDPLVEEPPVQCSWSIDPKGPCPSDLDSPTSGTQEWQGWRGQMSIDLPSTIGVYELSAECVIGGAKTAEPLRTELLVTYGPPVFAGQPPEADLYERASSWACGSSPETAESEVLERVLAGLYAYGNDNWRYGSFDPTDDQSWPPYDEGQWWSCPWQALVEDQPTCNYADCYEFSQVFEHAASALGIGVFEPVEDVGAKGVGFVTVPSARSLDPAFETNVDCTGDGPACPSYLFAAHSLRSRDGKYYDATFNNIYDAADEFIMANLGDYVEGAYTTLETSHRFKYLRLDDAYGDWAHFEPETPSDLIPALPLEAADPYRTAGVGSLGRPRKTRTENGLHIQVDVELEAVGTFGLHAHLTTAEHSGHRIPSTPAGSPTTTNIVLAGPLSDIITMNFAYSAIRAAGGPGKYRYRIELLRAVPPDEERPASIEVVAVRTGTVRISAKDLAVAKAFFVDSMPKSVRTVESGDQTLVVFRYRVSPPRGRRRGSGGFALLSRLALEGRSLSYGADYYRWSRRRRSVELAMPLPEDVADGPLELTTELLQNQEAYWYQDAVDFLRATVRVSDGEVFLDTMGAPAPPSVSPD